MSISKFQNVIKGGCGQVVIFGMAAVFIGGLAYQGCGVGSATRNGGASGEIEVAQVGGVTISAQSIQKAMEAKLQQMGGSLEGLPPSFEILLMGQALNEEVERANSLALAKQNGVDVSDAAILKFIDAEVAKLPQQAREQLTAAGQLKAGASEAELDAAVKKISGGKSLAELVKAQGEEIRKQLTDPEKGPQIKASVAQLLVLDSYKKKANVSDDELRKSFDMLEVKRIIVPFTGAMPGGIPPSATPPLDENAARQKAEKALAEVKGGKSFEDAMIAYSGEPAQTPGKKISENSLKLDPEMIATQPQYAALRNLKPGEVSGVEKTPEGFVIYKAIAVNNELPKDFAARSSFYREQIVNRRAQKAYQDDLKRYGETNKPRFSSEAYEALYAYTKLSAPMPNAPADAPPPTPTEAQLREIIDLAKGVGRNEPDFRVAAVVRRAAFDRLYQQAKDKNALAEERAETLLASAEAKDDFDTRIELVDLYLGQRKYAQAAEQLEAAARANTTYDPQGQTRFGTISSKLVALKKDGQLPADAEARIQGEQDRWRDEKKNADTAQAEAARLQAEDEKRRQAAEKASKANPKIEDVPAKR